MDENIKKIYINLLRTSEHPRIIIYDSIHTGFKMMSSCEVLHVLITNNKITSVLIPWGVI